MIERLVERRVAGRMRYTAVEPVFAFRDVAASRLQAWAEKRGLRWSADGDNFRIDGPATTLDIAWLTTDLETLDPSLGDFDVVLAHAVLDLLNLDRAIPRLLSLLRPDGFFLFSLNFDGQTEFLPVVDPALERQVIGGYHQSMDRRPGDTGGSRSGRRLVQRLRQEKACVLAIGSSDWWIQPQAGGYPGDEAFFLRHILSMLETSVGSSGMVGPIDLDGWLRDRRRRIDSAELTFTAHHIDVLGRGGG